MASQGGGAPAPPPPDDGKMINLNSVIDQSGCYARNEAASFPMTNLFIGDSRLGCQSDTDEQLILHVAFREFVKVREKINSLNFHREIAFVLTFRVSKNNAKRSSPSKSPNLIKE